MSDRYNGGISVKIGSYQLKKIAAYVPSWEIVKDTFTAYDYRTVSVYRGRRFKLSVTTGYLTPDELHALQTALFAHSFTIVTPDFTGAVLLDSCSQPLEHANIYGKYYTVSFAVSAVALTGGSGSL